MGIVECDVSLYIPFFKEWLNMGLNKLKNVGRIVGKELLVQLTAVETVHKELERSFQRFRAARKAA